MKLCQLPKESIIEWETLPTIIEYKPCNTAQRGITLLLDDPEFCLQQMWTWDDDYEILMSERAEIQKMSP
jgi:hypothetical protein